MLALSALAFDAAHLAEHLRELPDAELDALPFGVVEMDLDGVVRRYNAAESKAAGLSPERALGRHFFRDVAPCCNNRHVAQRFDATALDETIDYTFALRMKPVRVKLRLLKPAGADRMHLLVQWG